MSTTLRISLSVFVLAASMGCGRDSDATGNNPTPPTSDSVSGQVAGDPSTRPGGSTSQPATAESEVPDALLGTWVAKDVDSKLGEVKIKLVFREEGRVKILAWSDLPLVGKVRDKSGPYEVHGNRITSEAIRGGTTVKYRFDGGDLIIEYEDGKTVRFQRQ